jgi:hypothetical protein
MKSTAIGGAPDDRDEARRIAVNIAMLTDPLLSITGHPTFGVRPQSTIRDQAAY